MTDNELGPGPVCIGTLDEAADLLDQAGIDTKLLRRAIVIGRHERSDLDYAIRGAEHVLVVGIPRQVQHLSLLEIELAVGTAAAMFLTSLATYQDLVEQIAAVAPWAPLLRPNETIGQLQARIIDYSNEVELLVTDIEREAGI